MGGELQCSDPGLRWHCSCFCSQSSGGVKTSIGEQKEGSECKVVRDWPAGRAAAAGGKQDVLRDYWHWERSALSAINLPPSLRWQSDRDKEREHRAGCGFVWQVDFLFILKLVKRLTLWRQSDIQMEIWQATLRRRWGCLWMTDICGRFITGKTRPWKLNLLSSHHSSKVNRKMSLQSPEGPVCSICLN